MNHYLSALGSKASAPILVHRIQLGFWKVKAARSAYSPPFVYMLGVPAGINVLGNLIGNALRGMLAGTGSESAHSFATLEVSIGDQRIQSDANVAILGGRTGQQALEEAFRQSLARLSEKIAALEPSPAGTAPAQ